MTCAKRVVRCTLTGLDGRKVVGENHCENPQEECPRKPGEGYTKCKTICRQKGHAEERALAAWQKQYGNAKPKRAILVGHTHYCDKCAQMLKDWGVETLYIMGIDHAKEMPK